MMDSQTTSTRLARTALAAWAAVGMLILLGGAIWVLIKVQTLIAPVVISGVLIYMLNPVVTRLRQIGIPRVLGAFIAYVLLIGIVVAIGFLAAPSIRDQATEFSDTFPQIYRDTSREIEDIASNVGFEIDLWSYDELQDFLNDPDNQDQFVSVIVDRLGVVTSGLVEALLIFFLAPVIAFYVLIDLPRIRKEAVALIPQGNREEVLSVSRQLGKAVGGFLRGQLLVALIIGVLMSIGFLIIGLNFWLIIGMISGVLNIIPFVGPWVGGALGVIVGLVTADPATAVWAALVALSVQQIDNNFVSPTVLRATVHLHPALVILVLLLGGALAGLWGVLLAVPVAAAVKILAAHLWKTRVLGKPWEQAAGLEVEAEPVEPVPAGAPRSSGELDATTGEQTPDERSDPPDGATA